MMVRPECAYAPTITDFPNPDITPVAAVGFVVKANIPGQDSLSPWNEFTDHALVKLADDFASLAPFTYFDPSYGEKYVGADWGASEIAWSDASLASFYVRYSDGVVRLVAKQAGVDDCIILEDPFH
jgi:hypothetical protein